MNTIEQLVAVMDSEMMDLRPRTSENKRHRAAKSVHISPTTLRKNRVLTNDSDEGILKSFKILRTRIQRQMRQNGWTSLAVTSAKPDEGKTLTAVNLSISLAMKLDYTIVLVDADLCRPSVHAVFGFEPKLGLSDYLSGNAPLDGILVDPGIEHLVIFPGRERLANSSELLSSPKMMQLVDELKNRYPSLLLIFDLPPALIGDDVLAFSDFVDAVLLVVEEDKTQYEQLTQVMEILKHTNLLGTVLNKSAESRASDNSYY